MNGDAHAPGMGGSQPLPPSFSERPPRRLEASDEQALHPPFFPAAPATPASPAEPDWADPATYDVAPVVYSEEENYFAEPAAADEILPAPEDFGYQDPAEDLTAGEIPADAFLEAPPPPLPTYEEPAFESAPLPPLPTYEEPAYAAEPQPAYAEPAYAQAPLPTYEEASYAAEPLPPYDGPASPEAEVADRLEAFARELRSRGASGVQTAFSGDALDAALAGLVSGYLAARGH